MVLGFKTTFNGKPTGFPEKIKLGIKIHSIREDKNNRWKPGYNIEFATGVRTKYYDQFFRGTCKSVQTVSMNNHSYITIAVDGRLLSVHEAKEFALSDGFDSWEAFCDWWNPIIEASKVNGVPQMKYRIIHWTDFKY